MNPLFKIEVTDEDIKWQESEPDARTGESRDIPYQSVYVHVQGQQYPSRQKCYIPKTQRDGKGKPIPFARGFYVLDWAKAFVGYGSVKLSLNALVPMNGAAAPAPVKA